MNLLSFEKTRNHKKTKFTLSGQSFLMSKYNTLNLATEDFFIETVMPANYISQFRTHSKILNTFVTLIGFNKILC